jgi:hypothetical protein
MTARNDPDSPESRPARALLNYENAYALDPQRTNEQITSDFSKGVVLSSVVAMAIALAIAGEVPDPPIAGVCILFGVPLLAVVCGSIPLFAALAIRRSLLNKTARVRGRWLVFLAGVAYVAQIATLLFIIFVTGFFRSHSHLWAFVPLVPVLSPLWLLRRAH